MDLIGYAEASAALLNTKLEDVDSLIEHLAERDWLHSQCSKRDVVVLRKFQQELRPVFETAHALGVPRRRAYEAATRLKPPRRRGG